MPLRFELDNQGGIIATNSHGLTFYLTGMHGQPPPTDPPFAASSAPRYNARHASYHHGRRG
jgi:hypothetical protein